MAEHVVAVFQLLNHVRMCCQNLSGAKEALGLATCPCPVSSALALFHVHSGSQKKAADTMKRALEIFQCPAGKLIGHWALSHMLWHDRRQSLRHLDEARQI